MYTLPAYLKKSVPLAEPRPEAGDACSPSPAASSRQVSRHTLLATAAPRPPLRRRVKSIIDHIKLFALMRVCARHFSTPGTETPGSGRLLVCSSGVGGCLGQSKVVGGSCRSYIAEHTHCSALIKAFWDACLAITTVAAAAACRVYGRSSHHNYPTRRPSVPQ